MSHLKKNTVQLTLAMIGQKVLAFFYFLTIARLIGAESTGSYFLALSVTAIFSVLTDFGLQPVLIREVAKQKSEWQTLVRTTLSLKLVFVLLSSLFVIGFVHLMGYSPLVRQLSYVALGVMAFDAISLTMFGLLRGRQNLTFESIGMFTGQTITAIFGVAFLVLQAPIVWLVVALLLGSLFNAVFSTWMVARVTCGEAVLRFAWSWTYVLKLLKMAFPFALAGIFVKVYSYVDTLTISRFFGETDVGIYAVAYKLTYAFQFLPLAFVAALYPALSELVHTKSEKLSETFEQSMVYMAVLASPIVFGIWATTESLIAISVGSQFLASAPVLSVLIFVLFFLFLDFPIGSLLNAADRQGLKTTLMGLTMLINVVINVLLIPRIGVMGAAITANISFAFLFFSSLMFVPKFVRLDWPKFVWRLMRIFFAGLVMGLVVRWSSSYISFPLLVVLGALLYPTGLVVLRVLGYKEIRLLYAKLSSHA